MENSNSTLNLFEFESESSQSNTENSVILNESIKNLENKEELKLSIGSETEGCSDDTTDTNEIILAVYWKRGKLGAACYSRFNAELHILNDVVDVHPDFNNLRTLLNQSQPSKIITCGGLSADFANALSRLSGDSDDQTSGKNPSKKIFYMSTKKKELSYDSCKRYILGLRLGFEPKHLNEEDHALFMNSHIDLIQESMVISLGMLVKFLEKYLCQVNLHTDLIQITYLGHIFLRDLVSMDQNTYRALQIFNTKVHPSAFKRSVSGSNREGLSLFGILNRCKSNVGLKRMREILTNPSNDLEALKERLDTVEFFCKPQHQDVVQNIVDCIKRVDSVTGSLAGIYRVRANISHWRSLYCSLYNAILIGKICQRHLSHSKLLEKMAKSITQNIHEVTHYINQVVDFEESSTKNRFTVRNGIDGKLDLLRRSYAQIPDVLERVAELELQDLPSFIEQCSIIYITELGYLLSVPIWKEEGTRDSDYSLPGLEVKFVVNRYVYYKTPRCVGKGYFTVFKKINNHRQLGFLSKLELDHVLGDSVVSISELESKIMIALTQFVHARITDIVHCSRLIAELDCAISFATVALENNYRRPVLTQERKLEIVQGRHPLQELCVDNFVANDTSFDSDGGCISILTGPNASGKSVYLKQVALIAYLAHIGSFVPAEKALIPTLNHIHSRVQSLESISTRMSAFLIDLKQVSLSLYNSTPNSLVLIDEFGKGTTEIDGLSLLAATLTHFIERGENCPFVLVGTHFHRLSSLLPSTPLLRLQYMDYLIENEEIIYLHKIKEGSSRSSLTYLAAKTAGLTKETMERTLEIMNGRIPLQSNNKLEITKIMAKEISYMKKIFSLVSKNNSRGQKGQ